jgi:hypothetical protein
MTIDDAVKLLREARDVCEYPEFIQSSGNISHARQVRARIDAALTAYDAEPEVVETEPVEWEPCDGFSRIIKAPFTLEVQRMGRFWEWQAIELGVTRTEDEAKAAALRAARRVR